ncbi:MAG: T9SS type A sorting domain-containing protein [Bacteroidota bacterium]
MKKYLPFLFLCLPFLSTACSCIDIPTFCETITYGGDGEVTVGLIVRARKTKTLNDGMVVEIQDVLYGEESDGSLIVRDGNGADCGLHTGVFEENEELILALHRFGERYSISICGHNFLRIEDNTVRGNIKPGINNLSYEQFLRTVDCGDLKFSRLEDILKVYPTLTRGPVQLESRAERNDLRLRYNVYNALGRLMIQSNEFALAPSASEFIEMGNLAKGIYMVELVAEFRKVVYRIVVQ